MVMVKKSNDKWRMCSDYNDLNNGLPLVLRQGCLFVNHEGLSSRRGLMLSLDLRLFLFLVGRIFSVPTVWHSIWRVPYCMGRMVLLGWACPTA
ncbi:hypothetical protein CR513_19371, partial [Mucuna pruriens]